MTKEEIIALFERHDAFAFKKVPKLGTKEFDEWLKEREAIDRQMMSALKENPNITLKPPPAPRGTFIPATKITDEPTSPSE